MARKTHTTWCILFLLSIASLSSACYTCKFPPKGSPANPFCPRDTLKLGVCADLLGGVVAPVIGTPPRSKCCTVLDGLVDLEAAACLCTAMKANVLGVVNLNVPVALSLLVSACGKKIPDGFKCI